ncbi:unnamed protein product [Ceratitis capitata]|uniref:(Mediterranean fruit fly) hypothetical protein n=1 Tax=Ceratitis capitata TaxID=7213 RepID=A0A811UNV7_CERCA|nr:unnamed protein product [Ceratitis capitata]
MQNTILQAYTGLLAQQQQQQQQQHHHPQLVHSDLCLITCLRYEPTLFLMALYGCSCCRLVALDKTKRTSIRLGAVLAIVKYDSLLSSVAAVADAIKTQQMRNYSVLLFIETHRRINHTTTWHPSRIPILPGDRCFKIAGRGIFTTRELKRGDIIFRDSPLLIGPSARAEDTLNSCSVCFKMLPDTKFMCRQGCGLPVCSLCGKKQQHKADCTLFKSWKPCEPDVPIHYSYVCFALGAPSICRRINVILSIVCKQI